MKKIILTIIVQIVCMTAAAQNNSSRELIVLHFNHGDSVSLRWIPTDAAGFERSAKDGYIVQRRKQGETSWQSLSPVLKPLSNSQMEILEATDDDIYPLREIIYGSDSKSYESGGSKISNAEKNFLYAMASLSSEISPEAARAAALFYSDKNVERNAVYEYRVVFGPDKEKGNARVGTTIVRMAQPTVLPQIDKFNADFDETKVIFDWSTAGHDGYYSAYRVERSTDSIHFEPVKQRPFLPAYTSEKMKDIAIYRDTFPDKEIKYYYRVAGYSPFGFYGPYSKVVSGTPLFIFKKIGIKIDTILNQKKYVEIKWNIEKKHLQRIKGIQVMRSRNLKDYVALNKELLPATAKSFKDYSTPITSNYYSIVAYGFKAGEIIETPYIYNHIQDSIPPIPPSGLKAVVDSAGVTTISWNKNSEPDIHAYRLYGSNTGRDDDYFTLQGSYIKDTVFYDTLPLNTIDKYKYYKATAVDLSYNESDFSEAVRAVKPDTVAPQGVAFRLLRQEKGKVVVEWKNIPDDDAEQMELYRQIGDTGKVELIAKYDLSKKKKKIPLSYTDSRSFSGEYVQYFMTVRDGSGNETRTFTERLRTEGEFQCITGLHTITVNTEKEKSISLSWQATGISANRYVIYRKIDNGRMLPIASTKGSARSYKDSDITIGATYTYIVRAVSTENVCPAVYADPVVFEGAVK